MDQVQMFGYVKDVTSPYYGVLGLMRCFRIVLADFQQVRGVLIPASEDFSFPERIGGDYHTYLYGM